VPAAAAAAAAARHLGLERVELAFVELLLLPGAVAGAEEVEGTPEE
jgi:hypothetical protein